jgi:hypothetical protein
MKLVLRYILLIVVSALAGVASGILSPAAARSGLLGIAISLGLVFINSASRKRLTSREAPAWKEVLLGALFAGCLGGFAVNTISTRWIMPRSEWGIPITPAGGPVLFVSLVLSLALHVSYAMRWRFQSKRGVFSILLVCLAGIISTVARAPVDPTVDLIMAVVISLFGVIPFALLWVLVAIWLDPAWSFERWQRFAEKA